ncbi:GH92 family glycosyl hydrolase [Paenibacillus sp. PsM32]|uniref:GH92 family glycosyl hydrolase n=1 Tax=Paenibacillus sp. PsM32 TaxID=3030536 RepID=UPI00263B3A14|nr:GH92 family glycosyl hydrolase [Paenibacillus sp. PsM32]MDN4617532.1 GH92 family glycosyl hydrolase [Paenibacillus sp. PsM32]
MEKARIDYVDPFIGVDGENNCLCGPYLPNSIVRLSPDTLPPQLSHGYDSQRPIVRFSHTHVSGTGGGGRYGNIGITPFIGEMRLQVDGYEREHEQASAGYYYVRLMPEGIQAELTSTARTGCHRYTFPEGISGHLWIDSSAVIQVEGDQPGATTGLCIGGYLEKVSSTELVGRSDFRGGWGHDYPYSIYFSIQCQQPFSACILADHTGIREHNVVDGKHCRAAVSFDDQQIVEVKVGISYVSIGKAKASIEREAVGGFDDIRQQAGDVWEQKLSRITVEGGSEQHTTLLYTLLTRLWCMPSDLGIDDEYHGWVSGVRQYTDLYALWDSVRNANSLLTLIDPELEIGILNSLLDIANHIGWLPDAWIAGHSAMIQGGSSADILFNEAMLKGLPDLNYKIALAQMRKNNEVYSPDTWMYGRYLEDYLSLGYLSTHVPKNAVSRHMEYSYQDWCIGSLAESLGELEIAEQYYQSSTKLWNLWNDERRCFAPRLPDGRWVEPFDPAVCRTDSWNDPYFYEGTSWQWSFSTHHDFAGLIERHGGNQAFVEHLNTFFDNGYYYSKETMLHIPYLYIYAGRPDLAAERVRECMQTYFKVARDGLGDNEDMGCQSAFFICSALGLYPLMGQDIYFLVPPVFDSITLRLGTESAQIFLNIVVEGDTNVSDRTQNRYIAEAWLNDRVLDRAWIRHHEIQHGGQLRLRLSRERQSWGSSDLPPSPLQEWRNKKQTTA